MKKTIILCVAFVVPITQTYTEAFRPSFIKPTIIGLGLSYDDVLLIPQRTSVTTRSNVDTKTRFTKNIELKTPIVSSNMDTVTEEEMAIAIANDLGGIGVIHRFNTISQQARAVRRVKRFRNVVIEYPLTIHVGATIAQAKNSMSTNNVTSLLITNETKKLVGILTSRDIKLVANDNESVSKYMTGRDRLVVAHKNITLEQAKKVLFEHRIEKLPLINEDLTVAGLITSKDILKQEESAHASLDKKGRLLVAAAIGIKSDAVERAQALVEAGVDALVIDVAHGHCDAVVAMVKDIKARFPHIDIVAGNVVTADAVRELVEAGADAIKVGIGPGSICTTRITAGSGFPQLSAIIDCFEEAEKYHVPIIADGGIRFSGDITKAIAAGASTVMLGSLLAGTDESPGQALIKNGKKYKVVRGMASYGANFGREAKGDDAKKTSEFVPEGVEALTPYRGSVKEVVFQLLGGLKSGLSYCGVESLEAIRGKGQFIQITNAGLRESHPHDVVELEK